MYLKSLNLKGFKSFADRSVMSFEPGITAIVGPNGSGKSNISDAVLWVLGERNAKNLRGQAMEDVIFAGSSARKPVGIAEVDLVLDNSDGTLPIDFNEVALTRRVYRSGESEYLINGTIARRMDILDILHDTGIGTGTHSIISQGSLDSILRSKPEDRRTIIEEAAGVLKHKQRKLKSERKLAQMDTHLLRVQDLVSEIERQLKPLERKAKRAQAYQGLAAELSEIDLALAVDDLRILQTKWDKVLENEKSLLSKSEEMRKEVASVEAHMQQLQEEMQKSTLDAGDVAKQYRRAQSALERFDSAILLLHEKKRNFYEFEVEAHSTLDANRVKRVQAEEAKALSRQQLEETAASRMGAEETVGALEEKRQELSQEQLVLEKKIEEARKQTAELSAAIEKTRSDQARNQELLSDSRAHEKMIAGRSKDLQVQLEHTRKDLDEATQQFAKRQEELTKLQAKEKEAREAVSSFFVAQKELSDTLDSLRDETSLLIAEIKTLEEQQRAQAKSNSALAWLTESGAAGEKPQFLSDVVAAPQDLEDLVEALLGNDLQALLVSDFSQATSAIEKMGAQELMGEVTLLPQKEMMASKESSGKMGVALLSLLSFAPQYEKILTALIGDVFVCKDQREALAAHAANKQSACRYVTRDAFLVYPSGKIQFGIDDLGEEGILARQRRLEILRQSLVEKEEELKKIGSEKEELDRSLQKAQSSSLTLSQELAQLEGTANATAEERKRAEEKHGALQREFEEMARQQEETREVLAQAQPTLEALGKTLQELNQKLESNKQVIESSEKEISPLRDQLKEVSEKLAAAQLEHATLKERETYASRIQARNEEEGKTLDLAYQETVRALAKKRCAQRRINPLLELFAFFTESIKRWVDQLESMTAESQDSSSGLHQTLTEARNKARLSHEALDQVNESLAQVRIEKGRLEIQVEAAIRAIVEDCKTPLETALTIPPLEERSAFEENAFKLRRRIANMGTINPDAAVEYEEVSSRFEYMNSQLEDMKTARRALARIVRVIDSRMKDDFITTFDQVNKNFKEVFSHLFPGGTAQLSLVDPEDPEHSGVEVTAQPRGKRITKMMLMSGGEKSLTALALLFAVYRIRATPFYILDEVEAALDDTNLRRLCAYFNDLRDETQLILITHQRRTMELADTLYGISMQADGVTKVVSQKLDRALQYAEG